MPEGLEWTGSNLAMSLEGPSQQTDHDPRQPGKASCLLGGSPIQLAVRSKAVREPCPPVCERWFCSCPLQMFISSFWLPCNHPGTPCSGTCCGSIWHHSRNSWMRLGSSKAPLSLLNLGALFSRSWTLHCLFLVSTCESNAVIIPMLANTNDRHESGSSLLFTTCYTMAAARVPWRRSAATGAATGMPNERNKRNACFLYCLIHPVVDSLLSLQAFGI